VETAHGCKKRLVKKLQTTIGHRLPEQPILLLEKTALALGRAVKKRAQASSVATRSDIDKTSRRVATTSIKYLQTFRKRGFPLFSAENRKKSAILRGSCFLLKKPLKVISSSYKNN